MNIYNKLIHINDLFLKKTYQYKLEMFNNCLQTFELHGANFHSINKLSAAAEIPQIQLLCLESLQCKTLLSPYMQ